MTSASLDLSSSTTTFCTLDVNQFLIHLCVFPPIPYHSIVCRNRWWGTELNAFEKSNIRQSTCSLASRLLARSSPVVRS